MKAALILTWGPCHVCIHGCRCRWCITMRKKQQEKIQREIQKKIRMSWGPLLGRDLPVPRKTQRKTQREIPQG